MENTVMQHIFLKFDQSQKKTEKPRSSEKSSSGNTVHLHKATREPWAERKYSRTRL